MICLVHRSKLLLLIALLTVGCGTSRTPPGPPKEDAGSPGDRAQFLLPEEPAGAQGVIAVRQQARDGDVVIVVGRIGGSKKPFTEGRASFLIVDPELHCADEKCFDFS
jgi:hypothetical protein